MCILIMWLGQTQLRVWGKEMTGFKVHAKTQIKGLSVFQSNRCLFWFGTLEFWESSKFHFVFRLCKKSNSPGKEQASGGTRCSSPSPASSRALKFHLFPCAGCCCCDHRSTCLSVLQQCRHPHQPGRKTHDALHDRRTKQRVGRQDGEDGEETAAGSACSDAEGMAVGNSGYSRVNPGSSGR